MSAARTWTVSDLVREVNELLGAGFSGLQVQGELSNLSRSARGHRYFTLKDADAQLDCVMWARTAARVRFELEDGLAVRVSGSLTVYAPRGRFQLVVESLEPEGIGALQLAFEQLKRRLEAEGLFAAERKRPLPDLPLRVGVVTSPAGAALRDILAVLGELRHLEVLLAPTRVQGDGAAGEIAAALTRLGQSGRVDVILLCRGGGSLEDLWAFNEEVVARAVVASPVPVVAGIGHETDLTIADLAADLRVPTPTRAAELVAATIERQVSRLDLARRGLGRGLARTLRLARTRLAGLEGSSGLARVPARVRLVRLRLERARRLAPALAAVLDRARTRVRVAEAHLARVPGRVTAGGHRRLVAARARQLRQLMSARSAALEARLVAVERALRHLSPRRVLERGYSITRLVDGTESLRDARDAPPGSTLVTTLAAGELRSVVAGERPARRRQTTDPDTQPRLFDDDEEDST